jgi:predicted N-acyltransferase
VSTHDLRQAVLPLRDATVHPAAPRHSSLRSDAGAYTIRLFDSASDIERSAWEALCASTGATVFMDLRFVTAVEAALKSSCRFWFAIVYDDELRPAACAGFTAMTVDFTDFGDRRVTWIVKYAPFLKRFRNMRMLFCSLPGSPGDRSLVISPEADSEKVLTLLDREMLRLAAECNADAVILKEFSPDDLAPTKPLLGLGYQRVEIPAMHLLDPAFGKTFAEYCAALRTRYRQQVNKSTRKLKNSGIVSTVLADPEEILRRYTRDTHAMYEEMTRKSDLRIEVLPYEYFRELVHHLNGRMELVSLIKDDGIVAFGWCCRDEVTYHMMYAGIDYRLNKDFDLYFNLMYAGFDRALRTGVSRIHVGQTATVFKARMGCFHEPRYVYTKGVGFFMSWLFRLGSSLLVIKKPSNPPADIFKRPG